jgi:inhibitor of cysteine peptidase
MKKKIYMLTFILLFGLVLSACQPDEGPTNSDYSYGQNALVDSVEVVLLESFPIQAQVIVTGNLPDGCTELHEITVEREGDQFVLTINTRRPTGDVACTEALVPFEETVDLDIEGLEVGSYTVVAQDQEATFTLDVDNILSDQDDGAEYAYGNNANIEDISAEELESFPVQVVVAIEGNLPDGCTEIDEILTAREGNTFTIEIVTRRPTGDVACTMALVPFEEKVDLDVEGLEAGTYKVVAQDQETTFILRVDNVLPDDDEKFTYGQSARLEDMRVNVMESFPVQVSVTLDGYLPDGCTEIHEINAVLVGDTFDIDIITRRPTGDIACTMAIVPFEETVKLDVEGLSAGTYQVVAEDVTGTFTLDVDNAYP